MRGHPVCGARARAPSSRAQGGRPRGRAWRGGRAPPRSRPGARTPEGSGRARAARSRWILESAGEQGRGAPAERRRYRVTGSALRHRGHEYSEPHRGARRAAATRIWRSPEAGPTGRRTYPLTASDRGRTTGSAWCADRALPAFNRLSGHRAQAECPSEGKAMRTTWSEYCAPPVVRVQRRSGARSVDPKERAVHAGVISGSSCG